MAPIKSAEILEHLIDIHSSLGQAVHIMSTMYGIAILTSLVSCLLHVVATAYFLLLEILEDGRGLFFTVQLLWLIVHNGRLLMVVEPCHSILTHAMKTTKIVCDIQRYCKDPSIKEKVCTIHFSSLLHPLPWNAKVLSLPIAKEAGIH